MSYKIFELVPAVNNLSETAFKNCHVSIAPSTKLDLVCSGLTAF